jgi:hypothetical protein cdivTM_02356
MKFIKLIFISIFFFIIISIGGLFLLRINPQTELIGDTQIIKEKPKLRFMEMLSGNYQLKYEKYFGTNFPLRNYLVKGMNQILYNFGSVNIIEKGENNELYLLLWTKRYLMYDFHNLDNSNLQDISSLSYRINYEAGEMEIDEYLRNIKYINDYLEKKNKKLIYIVAPNKAEIYNEDMPVRFKVIERITTEENKSKLRKKLMKYLNENNILNIDATDSMVKLKKTGKRVFPIKGIHWNNVGSSQIIYEINEKLRNNGVTLPKLKLSDIQISKEPTNDSDIDAKNLLNVYFIKNDPQYYNRKLIIDDSTERNVNAFAITTSFFYSIQEYFVRNMPFNKIKRFDYDQYNVELYYENKNLMSKINQIGITEQDYQDIIDKYDVLIIEHTSMALPKSHIEFISNLKNYLRKLDEK